MLFQAINILYLGNDLSESSKYHNAYQSLKVNLRKEKCTVFTASKKKNQFLRLLDMLWNILKLSKKVDVVLIDTFSTRAFYFSLLCSQLARVLQLKYIPILHGGDLPLRIEKSVYFSNLIFNNAHVNVAPSGYLESAFKAKGYHTVQISNAITIQEYEYKKRVKLAPNLLYVRAFAKIYNPKMAVSVLHSLLKEYPKATLCMVGPDRDGTLAEVKRYIQDLNLQDKIKITGVLPKEDWHKLSKEYDFFINTTNVDNTPVSLIEAMALGVPVISTDVGGVPYLLNHNEDGFLVSKNNDSEMQKAIAMLLENTDKATLFSKKGREKAAQMDWEVVKHKWFKILAL